MFIAYLFTTMSGQNILSGILAKFVVAVNSQLYHQFVHPGGVLCFYCLRAEGLFYRLTKGWEHGSSSLCILFPSLCCDKTKGHASGNHCAWH